MGAQPCSCNDTCAPPFGAETLQGIPAATGNERAGPQTPQQAIAQSLRVRNMPDPAAREPLESAQNACAIVQFPENHFEAIPEEIAEPLPPPPARPKEAECSVEVHAVPICKEPAPEPASAPTPETICATKPARLGVVRFEVRLSRNNSEDWGFAQIPAEDGSGTLMIIDVAGTPNPRANPTERWNAEQTRLDRPELIVQRGDRIVSIAGVSDNREAMLHELGRSSAITFNFERWPILIAVPLRRQNRTDKLGIQVELLQKPDGSRVLRIGRISGGLMSEWNSQAVSSGRYYEAVVPGSEVESVDDIKDDPEGMRDAIVSREHLDVVFRRLDPSVFKRMSLQLQSLQKAATTTSAAATGTPVTAG